MTKQQVERDAKRIREPSKIHGDCRSVFRCDGAALPLRSACSGTAGMGRGQAKLRCSARPPIANLLPVKYS
jgi:hypothetical protein